jgi:hypothetical protein
MAFNLAGGAACPDTIPSLSGNQLPAELLMNLLPTGAKMIPGVKQAAQAARADAADTNGNSARWTVDAVAALFALPFNVLLYQAQTVHRAHFDPAEVQLSTLLSIKTGGCAENCSYCPQSAAYDTGVEATALMKAKNSSPPST